MYADTDSAYTVIAHFEYNSGSVTYIGYDWSDGGASDTNTSTYTFYGFARIAVEALVWEYEPISSNERIYVSYWGLDSTQCGNSITRYVASFIILFLFGYS